MVVAARCQVEPPSAGSCWPWQCPAGTTTVDIPPPAQTPHRRGMLIILPRLPRDTVLGQAQPAGGNGDLTAAAAAAGSPFSALHIHDMHTAILQPHRQPVAEQAGRLPVLSSAAARRGAVGRLQGSKGHRSHRIGKGQGGQQYEGAVSWRGLLLGLLLGLGLPGGRRRPELDRVIPRAGGQQAAVGRPGQAPNNAGVRLELGHQPEGRRGCGTGGRNTGSALGST
jgi:hypothetical protein